MHILALIRVSDPLTKNLLYFLLSSAYSSAMAIKEEHLAIAKTNNPFSQRKDEFGIDMTQQLKEQVAYLYSENYSISEAGLECGLSYERICVWRQEDPAFRTMLENARLLKLDRLESVMWNQATHGVRKVVVAGGRVVMDPTDGSKPLEEVVFDTRQQEFLAKSHDRERYGDKVQTDANINVRSDQAKSELDAAIEKAVAADKAALAAEGTES